MKNANLYTCLFFLIFVSFLIPCKVGQAATPPKKSRFITISLPAEVIEQAIKKTLPIPIRPQNTNFKGTVTVDSVRNLRLHKNTLSLQAHLTGKNMKVTTQIAGRNIAINVGTVALPISGDFSLRFDKKKKTLYIKPKMNPPGKPVKPANPEDMLQLLIMGLSGQEYPVALDDLQPLVARIGDQLLTVRMDIRDIQTADNKLVLKLTPKVGKSR